MKITNLIYSIFFICLFGSCVHKQNKSPEFEFNCILNKKFKLEVLEGEIKELESETTTDKTYHIKLNSLRGGETLLFGIFKINDKDGHKYNRISIFDESKLINSTSILNIKSMDHLRLDSLIVYDLNQLVK
jgi:hypothetical protein